MKSCPKTSRDLQRHCRQAAIVHRGPHPHFCVLNTSSGAAMPFVTTRFPSQAASVHEAGHCTSQHVVT
jgi:hypothetical protein